MSMIFQSYAVWPHMTVFQNVAYGLKFKKLPGEDAGTRVEKLLRLVHLDTLRDRYPGELSGGQQQRVAIARALANDPGILLADEPTGNLDSKSGLEIMALIERLNREGKTIIMVTHSRELAEHAERIVHLLDGVMIRDEVVAERRVAEVRPDAEPA